MPAKKYHVALTEEQRRQAEIVARSYKHSQRERARARILLLADTNREEGALRDEDIAAQVKVCSLTVQNVRLRFVTGGFKAALYRQEQAKRKARVLDGKAEAFLIATVCSAPPDGQKRWSLHLLRDKLIQEGYTDSVSHETVRQTLKKMNLNPG
jgi:Homeodomain-like domain